MTLKNSIVVLLILSGLAMIGTGFFASYQKNDGIWGFGGFAVGALLMVFSLCFLEKFPWDED